MPEETRPAIDLDPDYSLDMALSAGSRRDRGDELLDINDGAVCYAGQALMPAMAPLAMHMRGRDALDLGDDWTLMALPEIDPARTDLLFEHHGSPGAYHVRVDHDREMTAAGAEKVAALEEARVAKTRDMSSEEWRAHLVENILREDAEMEAINADPANWQGPTPHSGVKRVSVTALDVDGPPPWAESTGEADAHLGAGPAPDIWWMGKVLSIRQSDELEVGSGRRGEPITDLRVLDLLGRAAREAGFDTMIAAENVEIGTRRWRHFGDSRLGDRLEAGMASVCAAGGAVDRATLERVGRAAACLPAQDLARNLDEVRELAETLDRTGRIDREHAYVCNDLDDRIHVSGPEGARVLHYEGQNGKYDIAMSEDDVRITRSDVEPARLVGDFICDGGALTPSQRHYGEVPVTIRAFRDLNSNPPAGAV